MSKKLDPELRFREKIIARTYLKFFRLFVILSTIYLPLGHENFNNNAT